MIRNFLFGAPMVANPKNIDRRQSNPTSRVRVKRTAGGTVGTLFAVLLAFGYRIHTGEDMPAEVAAAIGGIITWFLMCLDDLIALFWNRRSE